MVSIFFPCLFVISKFVIIRHFWVVSTQRQKATPKWPMVRESGFTRFVRYIGILYKRDFVEWTLLEKAGSIRLLKFFPNIKVRYKRVFFCLFVFVFFGTFLEKAGSMWFVPHIGIRVEWTSFEIMVSIKLHCDSTRHYLLVPVTLLTPTITRKI